jgi:hypothetical protein
VGVIAAGLLVAPAADAKVRRPSRVWDPGVEAIAHRVEELRGLRFLYPVRVDLLGSGTFSRSRFSAADSAWFARELRHLQALGVVSAGVTAAQMSSGAAQSPLGQYLPATRSISVYRTRMDALTRVVIAHELTHALDDQHYHFARAERRVHSLIAVRAYRAAVEGDARRIEDAYFHSLPVAQQRLAARAYSDLRKKVHAQAADLAALEWDAVLSDAPYTLGRQLTRLAVATGGEHALRALLTKAPFDDRAVLDPLHSGGVSVPWFTITITAPLQPGEVPDGRQVAGALDIYLLLASRTSPDVAFLAVDASLGGGTVWFKRDGTTCAHIALRPRAGRADDVMRGVDAFVAAAGPTASRQLVGRDVVLTNCVGVLPLRPGAISAAELVLAARGRAVTAARHNHVSTTHLECIGNAVLSDKEYRDNAQREPSIRQLGGADPAFAGVLDRARTACRVTTPK